MGKKTVPIADQIVLRRRDHIRTKYVIDVLPAAGGSCARRLSVLGQRLKRDGHVGDITLWDIKSTLTISAGFCCRAALQQHL